MFIKLGNLRDWVHLDHEEFQQIPVSKSNRVSIEVSSPSKVGLWYYPLLEGSPDTSNPPTFLTLSKGYERIQFVVGFDIAIVADAPISIKTNSGLTKHSYKATESFTKIVERRSMSPDALVISQQAKMRELQHQNDMKQLMERMGGITNEITKLNKSASATTNDDEAPKPKSTVDSGPPDKTTTTTPQSNETQANE